MAISASVCFVTLDVLRKILGTRLSAAQIVIGINLGGIVIFSFVLAIYGGWRWDTIFILLATIEAFTYTFASILYVRAVTLSPLSLTIPYLGFTPVVSLIVAAAVLGEVPDLKGLVGIVLVVVGAVTLHLGNGRSFSHLLTAPFREPGSWRMLVVAITWGTTTSLDKLAIAHGSEAMLGFALTLGSTLLLVFGRPLAASLFQPLERQTVTRPHKEPLLYLAGLVGSLAVICQFLAYRELLVAYVETIKRAGGLASSVIGILCFNEGGLAHRVPAAILMILGAVIIVL
jgi:drug/metabolite transporter (DMT)-like permease